MAISKKLRFEVFKRDNYTCQYCGKKSPIVILEIDHVIPISEGGQDILENLLTSCFECNRGKGKELLENYKEGTDPTEQAILLLERERQLKEYNEVVRQVRERKNKEFEEIKVYWSKIIQVDYALPTAIIRKALDYLPKEKILEAIDVCKETHIKQTEKTWGESFRAYFYGIIRSMTNNFERNE